MTETTLGQVAAAVSAATTPAAETIPVAGPPPVVAVTSTAPAAITLTPEMWAAYTATQARVAELETAERQRAADASEAAVKALQAKGEIKQAFELQRQQSQIEIDAARASLKQTQERAKRYALDGELARALASHPLGEGSADQLTTLWRHHFTVEPQGDSFAVQAPGFQPVATWIAAQLALPTFAKFLVARNPQGGTAGSTGTQSSPTAPATTTAPAAPQTLMEAIIQRNQENAPSTLDPRTSMSLPFGLGKTKQA